LKLSDKIIFHARSAIGTPYLHQGRVAGAGLDCVGLLAHIAKSIDLPYDDLKAYPKLPSKNTLHCTLASQKSLVQIDRHDLSAGDVMLLQLPRFKEPMQVAICTGPTMIHSYFDMRRVVEHSITPVWRARMTHAYRIVEPAHAG
jgi:cell wall-associated NlpC family hydrolase